MPEFLREFLQLLDPADGEEISEYLDSNPDAIAEMTQVVQQCLHER